MSGKRITARMDVSLIVSTRNRSKQLRMCLESVERIAFKRQWELILVDNGSLDDTAKVIQEYTRIVSFPTTYLFVPNPGKSGALNRAIGAAQGEVLVFTDDDCYPAEDFLIQIWRAFEDPLVGYVTGRVILHDPTDYPITINKFVSPRRFAGNHLIPWAMSMAPTWPFVDRFFLISVGLTAFWPWLLVHCRRGS